MPTYLKPDVLARAESLGLAARQVVEGLRVGDHKSPYKGFSVEFVQHRLYVPGDDIRHIDWKSYGRSERYTIKQYEQETNYIAHVLVDNSNSMRYGAGDTNKLEYAKLLAASLSYLILRQRDSVSLRVFNAGWAAELPVSSQLGHIHAITHTLEETQPRDRTRIGPLLDEVADRIGRRGLVFVITDALDDVDATLAGLRHLRFRGHEVMLFHVLHLDEVEFPLDGNIRFIGLEGFEELMTRPHLLRPAYLRVVGNYLDRMQRGCDGSGVDYVRLMTSRPLVAALGEYLVRRLQTGRR
ncbi:DUF58 domain-containing protein [Urbifossiella limnaea]|uniref:DUF58 domain-containing protein n=1 Tax=Urbifossiella limnaea TaxID=2528023 RepID=A0A517XYR4_9BACT|nr:DUF58 domain-containing protein [Urbifossiella limnaea]QDU22656.1 hypothetical protein ETAA1_46390 [Urbifossiella limnaea]